MTLQRISILGLGMIGGSLAKAIRHNRPGSVIIGLDTRSEYLDMALKERVIHKGLQASGSRRPCRYYIPVYAGRHHPRL